MQRKILIILIALSLFCVTAYASEPSIKASSAILAMTEGEQILYDKNPNQQIYPSGLAKLMTALVAYDKCGMDEVVTIGQSLFEFTSPLERSLGLKEGEQIKSGELIASLIVGSPNDAAVALALHCGGIDAFVGSMNEKAVSLGLDGSHFTNPTGNHDEQQYSTANDLLKIYKSIYAIPALSKVLESTNAKIGVTNKSPERTIWTGNSLSSRYYSVNYYYPYARGGKSSSSSAGGYSVVCSGVKGNASFICIVLNSILDEGVNYAFVDAKNLFEYGFNNFTLKTIAQQDKIMREIKVKNAKGTDHILLFAGNTLRCFILNEETTENVSVIENVPKFIYAPIKTGDIIGTIEYSYRGSYAGRIELASGDTLRVHPIKMIVSSILWFFSLKLVKLIIFIIVSAILIYLGVIVYIVVNAKNKSKKRNRHKQ